MRTCTWIDRALAISAADPSLTYRQIAAQVGVSRQAVHRQFTSRGLRLQHGNTGGAPVKYHDVERHCHQCGKPFTWTALAQRKWHSSQHSGKNKRGLIVCSRACAASSKYKGCCFICKRPLNKSRDYRHAHRECQSQWMRDYYVRRRAQQKGFAGDGGTGIFAG